MRRVNVALAAHLLRNVERRARSGGDRVRTRGRRLRTVRGRLPDETLILMSRAAARLGFRDAQDMIARINARVEADQCVWLIDPPQAGRSIAIPLESTEVDGVSLALCYAREANFPEPLRVWMDNAPGYIGPDEVLHLFGATTR